MPSQKLSKAANILRVMILTRAPHMIRDRKYHLRTYRRCMVGTEMVDWLLQQSTLVYSRNQAVGIWQALLEEGLIVHGMLDLSPLWWQNLQSRPYSKVLNEFNYPIHYHWHSIANYFSWTNWFSKTINIWNFFFFFWFCENNICPLRIKYKNISFL